MNRTKAYAAVLCIAVLAGAMFFFFSGHHPTPIDGDGDGNDGNHGTEPKFTDLGYVTSLGGLALIGDSVWGPHAIVEGNVLYADPLIGSQIYFISYDLQSNRPIDAVNTGIGGSDAHDAGAITKVGGDWILFSGAWFNPQIMWKNLQTGQTGSKPQGSYPTPDGFNHYCFAGLDHWYADGVASEFSGQNSNPEYMSPIWYGATLYAAVSGYGNGYGTQSDLYFATFSNGQWHSSLLKTGLANRCSISIGADSQSYIISTQPGNGITIFWQNGGSWQNKFYSSNAWGWLPGYAFSKDGSGRYYGFFFEGNTQSNLRIAFMYGSDPSDLKVVETNSVAGSHGGSVFQYGGSLYLLYEATNGLRLLKVDWT